jgi:NADPH2:quinone reductase
MQAMMVGEFGEPSSLTLKELRDPEPGTGEALIGVRAMGCNFFDILMIQGKYQLKPPFPFAPGREISGEILKAGDGTGGLSVGDSVFALLPWGGFSTHVVAPVRSIVRMPTGMSFDHAAAFGIVYQTSYFALVHRAGLRSGETLLVNAAAGGVGLAAVQIGKALGARVLAAAGSPQKLEVALAHGAEQAFDYNAPEWTNLVLEATNGRGADVVLDPVGGDVFDQSLKCIGFGGRLLVIGFTSGRIPTVQTNRILLKNISIIGLHWGIYLERDPNLVRQTMSALFALYEDGKLKPLISARFPFVQAAKALEQIAGRHSVGKILLYPGE